MVLQQSLGELHEPRDLLAVHLQDVEHPHLGEVEALRELVLRLLQLLVGDALPLLAVIVQLAALELLAVVSHLLEVLGLKVMQGLKVVLLHVVVQGVLQVGHALQSLAGLHQTGAEYRPEEEFSVRDKAGEAILESREGGGRVLSVVLRVLREQLN